MILDSDDTRQMVLEEFLQLCPFDGWNDETLKKAVNQCKIDDKFSFIIFENGTLDLAEFYIKNYNHKCLELALSDTEFEKKKLNQKVRTLLHKRFEIEQKNRIALQRLANFYANPKNFTKFNIGSRPALQGIKNCFTISDFIWRTVKDQSSDFNFYTKRLTLAKIIWRSFFVFLKDESEELEKTKEFIDSQIENVVKFSKTKARAKEFVTKSHNHMQDFFLNEDRKLKSLKEIFNDLPFIRLVKK